MRHLNPLAVISITVTIAIAPTTHAQFSLGGGSLSFGGSRQAAPRFDMGRMVRGALQKSRIGRPQTADIPHRGPRGNHIGLGSGPVRLVVDPSDTIGGRGENGSLHRRGTCPDSSPAPHPVIQPVEPTLPPEIVAPELPSEKDSALELTYVAQQAFARGDYEQATKTMDRVLELSPESAAAYQFRSLTYFARGDYDAAAADVYDTLLRGPIWTWKTVYPLFGDAQTYTRQYQALQRTAKASPDSMSQHFLLAYHHLMLGHLEHGKQELRKVLTIRPDEPVALQLLAAVDAANGVKTRS